MPYRTTPPGRRKTREIKRQFQFSPLHTTLAVFSATVGTGRLQLSRVLQLQTCFAQQRGIKAHHNELPVPMMQIRTNSTGVTNAPTERPEKSCTQSLK